MKGFVPTPPEIVDSMVALLFRRRPPKPDDTVLDPGCGTGEFIEGIVRWCGARGVPLPRITGVELDPRHLPALRAKCKGLHNVRIAQGDFLTNSDAEYRFIIGNPPYVAITSLSEEEKARYRARYAAAKGRFDLYLLFFEQALRSLAPGGRMVFITPEKYLYVETAAPLRNMLARRHVEEIRLLREEAFNGRVTYPTITAVSNGLPGKTRVLRRDGATLSANLPQGNGSWLPVIRGASQQEGGSLLGEVCLRISCGVATGADSVFVKRWDDLDASLRPFAHPTVAGRELASETEALPARFAMLIPYDAKGRLVPFERLGALGDYLARDSVRRRLLARSCVKRKPWYAFHETPSLPAILRPKILCKDIGERPRFWADRTGEIVPRHSVYYIVPRDPAAIDGILALLRSPSAHRWFANNCQRAAKGYLRLQSRTLQRLPVDEESARACRAMSLVHVGDPRQTEPLFTERARDAHTF